MRSAVVPATGDRDVLIPAVKLLAIVPSRKFTSNVNLIDLTDRVHVRQRAQSQIRESCQPRGVRLTIAGDPGYPSSHLAEPSRGTSLPEDFSNL